MREDAPYGLSFAAERVEVEAGKKAELKLRLQRHWKDFTGKVSVLPLAPAGNLRLSNAEIAAGKDEGTLIVDVPPGTAPGEYTLTVQGQSQVPYAKDAKAAQKPNVLVSLPGRPLTLVVTPKK